MQNNFILSICMYENKQYRAVKEKIKNKLKDSKKTAQSKPKAENADVNIEDGEIEEYYLGKDRDDERKRKAYVIFIFC